MGRSVHVLGLSVGLIAFVSIFLPATALASTISIQPLRQELELKPGQSLNSLVVITNKNDLPTTVRMSAESFGIINENYDYSFAQSEDAKKWINFDESRAIIKAHSSHIFTYSIGIPASAEPGEKYFAIFASVDSKSADEVSVINRVGELSYIIVTGNVTKRGQVSDFSLPQLTFNRQVQWTMRLQNSGSAHFRSKTSINATNLFGQAMLQKDDDHLILPGTVRYLESSFELGRMPGLYKTTFLVGQGDDPAFQRTRWIIYMPLWSIVVLLVVLLYTIVFLVKRKRKIWRIGDR